ncbi:MAG: hypothetical protein ACJAWL_003635 [Motiliproteus sp.]|jgi:hypothetical protein
MFATLKGHIEPSDPAIINTWNYLPRVLDYE